ncbi:M28 family metallopeptidase [Pelagerythrobacter aerophilus]|uniref:Peptidase M28 n=1 Tax=Pelagerythrobacter aerophilus TaxID=2306995 RepID=A0A418NED1_9SPHN|nr:M28 family metallopeptidase [Pelagerythrobacter aerophilus]RIV75869.1 peptidase M28 [Pelagerythrobacter aerophilus]
MIRRILAATTVLALAACNVAVGDPEGDTTLDIPEVEVPEISIETMKEATRTLSSDEFEGRLPGTAGEEKTVAYIAEQFEKAGLEPGNNGSWFQDVPLVEITGRDFAPLTVKADGETMNFDFGDDWVGVSYRETPTTKVENSELVFVGYGINAPEKNWNDYAGIDMTGKTAVILVNDPDYEAETLEGTFNGKAMTYYGRWTYKYEEAARQGATGAIIVHDTYPASYPWTTVKNSWSGPQSYAQREDGGADQTVMNGWVQKAVAEQILEATGHSLAQLSAAAKKKGFKPVPLGATVSTAFENDTRSFTSKNVIGILPGAERPEEYVLHTAHWDHLGRCAPGEEDEICNGAIDNATGTAALIALAEAHAKVGPADRSLVFLAVTAEEQGLLGSEYYGANPVFPLEQTVGGVNMDALSLAGPAKDVTVVGPDKSQLDDFLTAALTAEGRVGTPNPSPEAGYYYRSDHFSMAKRGLPMLYVDGGQDLVEGGTEAGEAYEARYRDTAYHAAGDEYDENWDWSGVERDLRLFYRLGRMMAMSTAWPNWREGDEFRRIRDEACAADGGC